MLYVCAFVIHVCLSVLFYVYLCIVMQGGDPFQEQRPPRAAGAHGGYGTWCLYANMVGPSLALHERAIGLFVWRELGWAHVCMHVYTYTYTHIHTHLHTHRRTHTHTCLLHVQVPRDAFERIWTHSVLLLQRGFKTGSILTVDEAEAKVLGPPWTRWVVVELLFRFLHWYVWLS
jgi:hypothetical protein